MNARKETDYLTAKGPNGEEIAVPVAQIYGQNDGPTFVIVGGTHGSEYVGIEAVKLLHEHLTPEEVSGRLITIPCLSVPAFYGLAMHINPVDNENPGRAVPGSPDGSYTERMVNLVWDKVIIKYGADALIDVHGGDLEEDLSDYSQNDLCGNAAVDEASEALARSLDMPLYVRNKPKPLERGQNGGLTQVGPLHGIATALAESGSHGELDPARVRTHLKGLRNAMKHLKMLEGEREIENPRPVTLHGFGGIYAPADGFWYPSVKTGEEIHRGMRIGVMKNFFNEEVAIIESDVDAVILGVMTIPPRRKGDMLLGYGKK